MIPTSDYLLPRFGFLYSADVLSRLLSLQSRLSLLLNVRRPFSLNNIFILSISVIARSILGPVTIHISSFQFTVFNTKVLHWFVEIILMPRLINRTLTVDELHDDLITSSTIPNDRLEKLFEQSTSHDVLFDSFELSMMFWH